MTGHSGSQGAEDWYNHSVPGQSDIKKTWGQLSQIGKKMEAAGAPPVLISHSYVIFSLFFPHNF